MTIWPALPCAMPMMSGILIYDYGVVQPYAWWIYVLVGTVYTLTVFIGQFSRRAGPALFSPQNAKPRSTIVLTHLIFLAAFLVCLWLESSSLARLPWWMTAKVLMGRHGRNTALLDWLNLGILLILRWAEIPLIYAPSKNEGSVTRENPSDSAWMNSPK